MPIIQENPTYFSDKPAPAVLSLNRGTSLQSIQQQEPRCGVSTFGARRKHSVTSYEDTEDGSEMETFLSSCESTNSYNGSEPKAIILSSSRDIVRNNSHRSYSFNSGGNASGNYTNSYSHGSLKRNKNNQSTVNPTEPNSNQQLKSSGISSLTRLGQFFKKSKSKHSVGSDSHASTIESSGIGPPTCTPDSSLSIYTNSLDGDSHSSTNSNQISPKHSEESMEDRFCSTYTFDDCGIFAANMYYNVGESSVFTIYHQHNNSHANGSNNKSGGGGSGGRPVAASSSSRGSSSGKGTTQSVGAISDCISDEFEDCVQPYYNNTTFSTFPNPKRCSVASAASTTTSSVIPVPITLVNKIRSESLSCITGKPTTTTEPQTHPIQHDRDGYLRPNEPRNLRNVKNLYINDSVIANANRNGQVQQVQVDVHTPTSSSLNSAVNQNGNSLPFTDANNSSGGGIFNSSAGSSSANSGTKYHFDSAGSTTSAATTLVAGGSNNFLCGLPEDENIDETNKSSSRNRNRPLPVYMNRAYFGSNSILPTAKSPSTSSGGAFHHSKQQPHQRISPASVAADCEPYCSLCASSIMGSPRQRSKMDVAIVKCKECFFSREAESHIRGFFDKLMTEDKQKMDVTLKSYDLKDLDHPTDRVVVHSAKVQIVIISHHFLQRLKDEASRRPRLSPINRVFRSKNVIAVLLAVSAREVSDGYESVLPRFCEWFSVDLRSTNKYDPEFCKKFTEQVVRIYNVELSNSSNFSVFPKKVTREQPKIAIVFKKPIEQADEVRVELKTGKQSNIISHVKLENPHTTLLRIPESLSPDREAIVDVSVFVNNTKIGGSRIKSELNMRRSSEEEDNLERMAKLLPPFLDWLDKHIAETLMKHYKECTDYTADPQLELMNGIIICKADILPTIMHFAAYYGLHKTAFTVLEEADGLPHCSIRNELDETPVDIAFTRGHTDIGQLIRDYEDISSSYKAFQYIKDIMENDTTSEGEGVAENTENNSDHDNTKKLHQFYEDLIPEEWLPEDVDVDENDDAFEDAADSSTQVTSTQVATESSLSDVGSSMKSEDEEQIEEKKPTPLARRAKTKQPAPCNGEYVNVDGNPKDNPELVVPREKKINNTKWISPKTNKMKRLTMMDNYDVPRSRDQDYEVPPPEVRPVLQQPNCGPVLKPKNCGPFETASGYLIMNDDVPETETADAQVTIPTPPPQVPQKSEKPERKKSPPSIPTSHTNVGIEETASTSTSSSRNDLRELVRSRKHSRSNENVTLDAADEQLIDLMNDFKNNTYDMKIVELLFENWKQRPDVQKSIEMKMEMLDKLRDEYRKLQHQQTKGTKKNSVLEKIKTSLTIISEVSCRTSIDSRSSDSSLESDKPTSETSSYSNKAPPPIPPDYNNPMSKRFIPSYVYPNTSPQITAVSEESAHASVTTTSPPGRAATVGEYEVPPPPRPVKPAKKISMEEPKSSPIIPRKPPVIPDTSVASFNNVPRTPPAVPAKPSPKYIGTEATSPPPLPPPRTNNTPELFNYIDYKKKNDEGPSEGSPSLVKKSYENMAG